MPATLDTLDLHLLRLVIDQPRAGVREYARVLGVARGTASARLNKLERLDVIRGWTPHVSAAALGFGTTALVRLQLAQGALDGVTQALRDVPEVIEADSIAGESDLLCRVVATGPENLEEVIQRILDVPGIIRTRTETVLRRRIDHRVRPLVTALLTHES